MTDIGAKITAGLIVFCIIVLGSFILSYPLMLLWNFFLVPATTELREVGWIQMWGISILLACLFKTTNISGK